MLLEKGISAQRTVAVSFLYFYLTNRLVCNCADTTIVTGSNLWNISEVYRIKRQSFNEQAENWRENYVLTSAYC